MKASGVEITHSGAGAHAPTTRSLATHDTSHLGAALRPTASAGLRATLLRVAWLAILLGLLCQLALLLAAVGLGNVGGVRPLAADTARSVCWSVLVCTGIALGRGASKGRLPPMGIAGLLAGPVALTIANLLQKAVAEALDVAGSAGGLAPLGVMVIKAAEYGCLGAALGWIGRRAWGGVGGHLAIGLITGLVFGAVMLALAAQSAPTPLGAEVLVLRGINELLFPVGCALVVYAAEAIGRQIGTDRPGRSQQPMSVAFANTDE